MGRGISWDVGGDREVFVASSQPDSKMVVSGSQIPSKQEPQAATHRHPEPLPRSYLHARDSRPGPHLSFAGLTDPDCPQPPVQTVLGFHWLRCSAISAPYWKPQIAPPSSHQKQFYSLPSQAPPSKGQRPTGRNGTFEKAGLVNQSRQRL